MENYLISIGQAAFLLGVCTKTIRRWEKSQKLIPVCRTMGNHRRYDKLSILKIVQNQNNIHMEKSAGKKPVKVAIYSRVSSTKQKVRGDLDRQIEQITNYCKNMNYQIVKVYKDVGSGLNDKRSGLNQMLKEVSQGKYNRIVINYLDRLSRFGIQIINKYVESWGVCLEIIHPVIIKGDYHSELITDLTAILYSFMGKLYRMRRK